MSWRKEQLAPNVFRATADSQKNKAWESWLLLSSDRHWDNPKSDLAMQKRHLEEAKKRDAIVVDCGDLFCAMQGKFDKRSSKAAVRTEHQVDNYLDALVSSAADWFEPYRENLFVIGTGNHETSIKNRLETDLTERFVGLLRARGAEVFNGHYSGWCKFHFMRSGRQIQTFNLHYQHGSGGGGAVTADMIAHHRRAVIYPDADILVSGHTHDAWFRDFGRSRISERGTVFNDVQTHIKIPSYKDDFGDGKGGWHVETDKPPKPIGAWWLRFYFNIARDRIEYEVIRAG